MVKEQGLILGLSGLAGCGKDYTANVLVERYGFVKVAFADPLKRICREVFDFSEEQLWGPSQKRNEMDLRYLRGHHVLGDDGTSCAKCGLAYSKENALRPCALTPRYALQHLGTEWGRHCYENVWVGYALRVSKLLISDVHHLYDSKEGLQQCSCRSDDRYLTHPEGTPFPPGVVIPDVRFKNELDALHNAGAKVVRIYRDQRTTLTGAQAAHASEAEQQEIPDSEFDYVFHNVEDPAQFMIAVSEMMITLVP